MTPSLNSLLFNIRQHAAFQELLEAVEPPTLPRYSPLKADSLETMGAKTVFQSGAIAQHERWMTLLTGNPETSQTEKT